MSVGRMVGVTLGLFVGKFVGGVLGSIVGEAVEGDTDGIVVGSDDVGEVEGIKVVGLLVVGAAVGRLVVGALVVGAFVVGCFVVHRLRLLSLRLLSVFGALGRCGNKSVNSSSGTFPPPPKIEPNPESKPLAIAAKPVKATSAIKHGTQSSSSSFLIIRSFST